MAKRETNKERRAREEQRRTILKIAGGIAAAIRFKQRTLAMTAADRELADSIEESLFSMHPAVIRMDARWIKNQSIENVAEALRLAADILEKKPMDGRSLSAHDDGIRKAYHEARMRPFRREDRQRIDREIRRVMAAKLTRAKILERANVLGNDLIQEYSARQPTFSEFLELYREQNPRVKVEDRALRRSLGRLGCKTAPEKRGRPKEK